MAIHFKVHWICNIPNRPQAINLTSQLKKKKIMFLTQENY